MDKLLITTHYATYREYSSYLLSEKIYLQRHGVTHIVCTNDGGRYVTDYYYNGNSRLGGIFTVGECIEMMKDYICSENIFCFELISLRERGQFPLLRMLLAENCIKMLEAYIDAQEPCRGRGCESVGIGKQLLCARCLPFQSKICELASNPRTKVGERYIYLVALLKECYLLNNDCITNILKYLMESLEEWELFADRPIITPICCVPNTNYANTGYRNCNIQ
jgi:hypothetical protein